MLKLIVLLLLVRIGKDTYGTKSGQDGIPTLQAADLGAFLAAKHIANSPEGKL